MTVDNGNDLPELKDNEKVFVETYLRTWNQTQAARDAGYSDPNGNAHRIYNSPNVQAHIQHRLTQMVMGANEVLARLSEQARAEYGRYIKAQKRGRGVRIYVDVAAMIADNKGHLIKGVKYDKDGRPVIEFPDVQAALVHIGRHHKLFTDRHELDLDEATKQHLSAALRDGRLSPQDILLAAPDLAKELFAQAGVSVQEAE